MVLSCSDGKGGLKLNPGMSSGIHFNNDVLSIAQINRIN
jgi:hypothetical protein